MSHDFTIECTARDRSCRSRLSAARGCEPLGPWSRSGPRRRCRIIYMARATSRRASCSPRLSASPARRSTGSPGRAGAAGDELAVHRAARLRCGRAARSSARWRGGGLTSKAWASSAWVFAKRAIWFRWLPMRATCRVGSTSAAAAAQVRVRAKARRSRSNSRTPAASALAFQAANSAAHARTDGLTMRRSAIGAPPRRSGGNARRSSREPGSAAGGRGFEGARSPPRQPNVGHWEQLAPDAQGQEPAVPVRRSRRS